ncbi:MAG: S41 family peptidase [Gemmatimonas sp.]
MRSLDFSRRSHTPPGPSRLRSAGSLAWMLSVGTMLTMACHYKAPNLAADGPVCANAVLPAVSVDGPIRNGAATFDSAWSIIARSHWDTTYHGVNWNTVRDTLRPKAAAARDNETLRTVLTQMVGTLGQSHFAIIPGEGNGDVAAVPGRDLSGTIGATVRDVDGLMLVTAVRAGGPADRAGVRLGFAIQAVDGCVVAGRAKLPDERHVKLTHWSALMSVLRGPVGDSVHVRMQDGAGKSQTFAIAREGEPGQVTRLGNLPAISAQLVTEKRVVDGRTIGVIRFNSWMAALSEGISNAVDSLRDVDAIVIDIRGNFGGVATMAPGVAGHFVDTSLTLGTMIQRGGVQYFVINPQRVNSANKRVKPYSGPVAIVVDELSISTSEIFAAGMQALGRARIFGAQTAGQALPSVAEQLPNGDFLYHAIANFLSPTGKPVEGVGVVPDVAVPVTRAQLLQGRDPAFDAALAWAASSNKHTVRRK